MKLKGLVKGALQKQVMKGVAAKGTLDSVVYEEYYKRLNVAVDTRKLSMVSVRILKGFLKDAKKVKEPNKYTLRVVDGLPLLFENRKALTDSNIKFIKKDLIPYLKSCQETYVGKELEAVAPLFKEELKNDKKKRTR